ncbi:RNA-binding protein 12 [Brachionichthys hirsutus]|uniref:RNA-binding protein 12 n=1 Tax=Brachionichthys hirsutus TaxID=412623 RepID=UPI0036048896
MAVVIRLQGLPIVAGTMDIRHFFSGLTIPDGGVHIVGGEHGEAFIVFATDEDARMGMMRTGGSIKGSKVSLLLSSKTEMQNMIELSRRRFEAGAGTGETAAATAGNANRQVATSIPAVQPGTGGRLSSHGNQGFNINQVSVTAARSSQEPASNKTVTSILPSFPNSYSSAPTISTALVGLGTGPPPIPPLPTMPSMPPMPTLPIIPVPPPVSSLPPVPTVSPLCQGPPVPPMSHLPHISSLPPFNPSLPPPAGLGSGLPLGTPGPMLFNPLSPLASFGLQAHMKAAVVASGAGVLNPDEMLVLLQNLPFSCTEVDIRSFFRGLGVDGVRLLRDGQGRPTGRAMVKFFSPQESFEAVKRGGGMMGQRFIEINPGTERQWNSINDSGTGLATHISNKLHNESQDQLHRRGITGVGGRDQRGRSRSPHRQEFCVYLKGLPYEADKKQIKEFFNNLAVIDDSIYIAYGPNGRATGEGFLEFKTEQDHKTALGAHMQYMGTRFIQVHPISHKGMLEKIDTIRKRDTVHGEGKHQDGLKAPRNCAHISNIPYNISKKDVRAFLEGVGMYEDTLKVLTDSNGNGLGQAVFQLRTEEDGRKAERLHRQKLNGRDAFVHLVTFEQLKEIERNPPPQNKRGQRSQNQNQVSQTQNQHLPVQPSSQQSQINPFAGISGDEFSFLRNTMGNLSAPFVNPFSTPGNGLAGPPPLPPLTAGLGDVNMSVAPPIIAGLPGAPILEPPGFRPAPAGVGPFSQDGLRGLALFENANRKGAGGGPTRGGGANNGNSNQGRAGGGATGGQQVFTAGADVLRNQPVPGGPVNPNSQHGVAGPTIVRLQNMPFTVTVDEIMDFFYGYQVVPGSVCLQFSEKGLPTGEAMVAFQNPEEATAAVMDLNDRPIGARKVKISLA